MKNDLRAWAELRLDALVNNLKLAQERTGKPVMAVIKGDAHGHGAIRCGLALQKAGAAAFAVACLQEAIDLRTAGIARPILILGWTPACRAADLAEYELTQSVFSEAYANELQQAAAAAGCKIRIHIKLDTGMSRLGFQCDADHFEASVEAICRVAQLPGLELEGIFTHFCVSDEEIAPSKEYTELQHKRFVDMIAALEAKGVKFELHHCCNSGATVAHPEYAYDMFRPGIITYGISSLAGQLNLKPVLTLKTVVGTIKEYTPETTIGYGRTYTTEKPMRVGVLPVGYADGFHRALSNKWKLWTPYGLAPIVGRICMDQCMVDLTDLPQVQVGDELEIWGTHLSIDDASAMAGTICNETICGISKRVPRVYIKGGKEIYRELLLRG